MLVKKKTVVGGSQSSQSNRVLPMHHQRTASHLSLLIADCLNRDHLLLVAYLTFLLPLQHSFVPLLSCPASTPLLHLHHPFKLPLIPPMDSLLLPLPLPTRYH